jgi:mannitol/fructose-specific phosphotransferase system IIA component (Ntr-type)
MQLRDYLAGADIALELDARSAPELLDRMVALLRLEPAPAEAVRAALGHREALGSTGMGHGIAIPHCRSPVVPEVRVAYGRFPAGVPFNAIDGLAVHHVFLIVAPPHEVSNSYLKVLAQVAHFAKAPDIAEHLAAVGTPDDFFALMKARGV